MITADKRLSSLGSQAPALSKSPGRLARGDTYERQGSNEGNPMPDTGHAETTDDVMNKRDTPGRGIDEPVAPGQSTSLQYQSTGAYSRGGAIPDDDQDDNSGNQQVAQIPTKPAGPGGDTPDTNPFPTKNSGFGRRVDNGAIPEGAANDQQTASLEDALQTVDKVMQYGYQQSGLSSGSDDDQQAAIPDAGAGAQAMAAGGPVGGTLPPIEDSHAIEMNQMTAEAAKRAIENARKQSTGTQRYDDGGPVDDQPQLGNPGDTGGEAIPSDGGQGVGQALGQVGQGIQSLARPAPGGQQGVQKILRLIQGADAMPPQQAQQVEAQTGAKDPNVAKALAIHQLAQTQGPQAAFAYLQSLRKNYDVLRTNAAVKADMGRLDLSTKSASDAMTNIVDGTDTRFQPSPDGQHVIMTSKKVGVGGAMGYDAGGSVTDDSGNDATAIPEQPQSGPTPNSPEAQANDDAFNGAVNKVILSIPQYYQMLRDKMGMFDHIWNTGPVGAAKQAAQSPGMQPQLGNPGDTGGEHIPSTPMPQPQGQALGPSFAASVNTMGAADASQGQGTTPTIGDVAAGAANSIQKGVGNMVSGAGDMYTSAMQGGPAPAPTPPTQGGTTAATPATPAPSDTGNMQSSAYTRAPRQTPGVLNAPNVSEGRSPAQQPTPDHWGPPSYDDLVKLYGKEAVDAARYAHPSVNGYKDMMAQLNAEREKQLGYAATQQNTKLAYEGRGNVATIKAGSVMGAAQIRAAASNVNSQNRLFGQLEGIAASMRNNAVTNKVKEVVNRITAGNAVTDQDIQFMQWVQNQAQTGLQTNMGNSGQVAPPMPDFTKTPGAVAPVQGQKQPGAPTQVQRGGMYYLTNEHGIILKGPSPTPLQ